jgi:hypothetical protein
MSSAARPEALSRVVLTRHGVRAKIVLPSLVEGENSDCEPPRVVHLVRAANGPAPLRAFAAALRRHPPGIDYRLVLALKGFCSAREAQPSLDELADLEPEALFLPDTGMDLGAYLAAAAHLRRRRYCFLNSYSVPLVDGWLAKLDAALDRPGVGVVGATGAWTSNRSWIAYSLGLPSAYRGLLPSAAVVRQRMLALMTEQPSGTHPARLEALRARALALRLLAEQERFPAYSLRTNAFMISHATLQLLRLHPIKGRTDSLALESGRDSITRQLQRRGLRTLVVDRAGDAFDHARWDRSFTFWQGDQQGLLVADNRTLLYERADLSVRRVLSSLTWGSHARPGPPGQVSQALGPGASR